MDIVGQVLVVCASKARGESLVSVLRRHGLAAASATSSTEALDYLKEESRDLVLVEAQIDEESGIALLAEIRKTYPMILRVLVENKPIEEIAMADLVNQAGPIAILGNKIEPEEISRLIAMEGPVSYMGKESTSAKLLLQLQEIKESHKRLKSENHLLSRELVQARENGVRPAGQSPTPIPRARAKEIPRPSRPSKPSASDLSQQAAPMRTGQELARLAGSISRAMDEMMEDPELVLPIFPPLGMEIQRLVKDDACQFEELAERIEQEQSVSARLLKVANSSLYAGLERTRNVHQAISRLGLRETRNILVAVLGENMFRTKNKSLAKLMAKLWMHSLCCAYSNENIASSMKMTNSEDYFVEGLLHDIGKLVVIHLLDQCVKRGKIEVTDIDEGIVLGLMEANHHEFGKRLMKKWHYSKDFENVVYLHNDDENINKHPESVVVTYFSNLLTRKIGYSLVPYTKDLLGSAKLADALNMTKGTQLLLLDELKSNVNKIQKTFL